MTIPAKPLRARTDGWTLDRQQRFLAALAERRNIARAAKQVGLSVRSAYKLRNHPAGATFRTAWDAALDRPFAPIGPGLLETALALETSAFVLDGEQCTHSHAIPARRFIALLDRAAARVAKGQTRAKMELS